MPANFVVPHSAAWTRRLSQRKKEGGRGHPVLTRPVWRRGILHGKKLGGASVPRHGVADRRSGLSSPPLACKLPLAATGASCAQPQRGKSIDDPPCDKSRTLSARDTSRVSISIVSNVPFEGVKRAAAVARTVTANDTSRHTNHLLPSLSRGVQPPSNEQGVLCEGGVNCQARQQKVFSPAIASLRDTATSAVHALDRAARDEPRRSFHSSQTKQHVRNRKRLDI